MLGAPVNRRRATRSLSHSGSPQDNRVADGQIERYHRLRAVALQRCFAARGEFDFCRRHRRRECHLQARDRLAAPVRQHHRHARFRFEHVTGRATSLAASAINAAEGW